MAVLILQGPVGNYAVMIAEEDGDIDTDLPRMCTVWLYGDIDHLLLPPSLQLLREKTEWPSLDSSTLGLWR